MRILVKKDNFEFEIDGKRLEEYLVFRHVRVCDVDYIHPFFREYETESVGHNFVLVWTFVGLFIGYGYDYVFVPLSKIVDIFNNNKKLIIDWNKVKKIKFVWLKEFYYAMNLKIYDIKLRIYEDDKESIREEEERRYQLYFEMKKPRYDKKLEKALLDAVLKGKVKIISDEGNGNKKGKNNGKKNPEKE